MSVCGNEGANRADPVGRSYALSHSHALFFAPPVLIRFFTSLEDMVSSVVITRNTLAKIIPQIDAGGKEKNVRPAHGSQSG